MDCPFPFCAPAVCHHSERGCPGLAASQEGFHWSDITRRNPMFGAFTVLRIAEAVGKPAVNGEVIPPAAARHAVLNVATLQPRAAIRRRALVIRVVFSGAPLPYVPMNVVQAESVGRARLPTGIVRSRETPISAKP